jgi:hypothetical protein
MSLPSESNETPNWAELAPNIREHEEAAAVLARQVRIMLAAGKDASAVAAWLQQVGFSAVEAEDFLAALLEAERQASRGELVVSSGPWDFGGVFASRDNPTDQRRARKARREKSMKLAATEPDPAFDFGGASHAQVLARVAQRPGPGIQFGWVVLVMGVVAAVVVTVVIALIAIGAI